MKMSDKYLKLVEWSEEDQCYVGTCPSVIHGGVHGDTEVEAFATLCEAVEDALAIMKEDGTTLPDPTANKDFSGKFLLRMNSPLHKALFVGSLKKGVSLNNYCVNILKDASSNSL
jgi:predicted HicB family RNase H-like nuclease